MPSEKKLEKKGQYFLKMKKLLEEYQKVLVVECDNVGSNHMQKIRTKLRGTAVLLMGKKTMMRKALREHVEHNPAVEALLPFMHGNIGFVFTNGDLTNVRNMLTELKVAAPAKAGTVSPNEVIVPAGLTGLEPTQTSFLQALNIASKINKGQVEIISPVVLLKAGDRVGVSEATLLAKLNIKPFNYGLVPKVVYDHGLVYDQKVLDMSDEDVLSRLRGGVQAIAAIGLQVGYPTNASVPYSIIRGFNHLVAIAVGTEYTFPKAAKIKEIIANPELAAAAAKAAAAASAPKEEKKAKEEKHEKKEEPKKEEKEEEEDMALDLFA